MSKKSESIGASSVVSLDPAYVKPEERVLDPTKLDTDTFNRLPNPTGWRLLILPYRGKGKSQGSVLLPDAVVEKDWIIFGRYAGARFKIDGGEVRVLNDDDVIAVIQDPEDILHF